MRKTLLLVGVALLSMGVKAQVGINAGQSTDAPEYRTIAKDAVLQVANKQGENKGVLLPSVTLTSKTDQTTTSGGDVTPGLLVWNEGTNGGLTKGYYYWSGSEWVKIGGVAAASGGGVAGGGVPASTIYSADGSLNANRTVNQNNHSMTYTTGATGKFIVEGTTDLKGTTNLGRTNLNGAGYVKVKRLTDGLTYTLKADDYMISIDGPTQEFKIIIPDASSDNAGRVVLLTNKTANNLVIFNQSGDQAISGTDQASIPANKGEWIVSDGTKWYNLINY